MFQKILAVIMIVLLALIFTRSEEIFLKELEGENLSSTHLIISMLAFFCVGFYGGFI